jgi:prepilin-type N-terminal cleavage/methylation domain-containing protein
MFTDQFLQRILHRSSLISRKNTAGFTLIELVVVIMIMGVMALALFAYLFPQKQLDKAKDAIRKHDAQEIKKALDLYYNDHNCYPTSVPFGSSWTQGRTIYMKKVPQDPDCKTNSTQCYRYQIEAGDTCPQWNVLYTRSVSQLASGASTNSKSCGLNLMPSCSPTNVAGWSCDISGTPNCHYIDTNPIPTTSFVSLGVSGAGACSGGTAFVCTPSGCDVGSSGGPLFCTQQECQAAYDGHQC